MRLNDIIIENEVTDEGVLGGIVGAAKGLMKGAPIKGYQAGDAQSSGASQTKAQATVLYKDFYNQMGQLGQQATGQSLIDYLTKKQYPTKQAQAILSKATPAQGNATADTTNYGQKSYGDQTMSVGTPSKGPSWSDPNSPDYVGRREVERRQAAGTPTTTPTTTTVPTTTPPATAPTKIEPTLKPPIVPSVIKPNPARTVKESLESALDAKTIWGAILAATQENLQMGGRGSAPGKTSAVGVPGSTGVTGSTGVSNATGLRGVSSGSGQSSPLDINAVLEFYRGLGSEGKIAFRKQLDAIDIELSTTAKTDTAIKEGSIGYSRFLGIQL
jgi:hypothetical protein